MAAVCALRAGENAHPRGQDGSVNTHRRMYVDYSGKALSTDWTCSYWLMADECYILKHLKNEQKVGMLLQKRTDTRGVGISSMSKSIYLLTTTPSSHTHRFHPLPLATPTSCSPHPYIPPTLHNCHPYFELCTS